jgi:putative membrane protein
MSSDDADAARGRLDRERTALANERTLLAYLRTALAMAAAGASLRYLPNLPDPLRAGSWTFIGLGLAILIIGLWRFTVVARRLRG